MCIWVVVLTAGANLMMDVFGACPWHGVDLFLGALLLPTLSERVRTTMQPLP